VTCPERHVLLVRRCINLIRFSVSAHKGRGAEVLGVPHHPDPQFWGPAVGGSAKFYVLYMTATSRLWTLAAAEQEQKCIPTYLC